MSKNKLARLLFVFLTIVALSVSVFSAACKKNKQPETVYYTVTFVTGEGSAVAAQQIESGKTATKPENPVYNGYTFSSWYTDEGCTDGNEYDFGKAVTGNLTLYAKWVKVPVTPEHTHTLGNWVNTDPEQHYKLCTDSACPAPTEKHEAAAHDASGTDGACSVCGYKEEGGEVVPSEWKKTQADFTDSSVSAFNSSANKTTANITVGKFTYEKGVYFENEQNGLKLEKGNISLQKEKTISFSLTGEQNAVSFIAKSGANSSIVQEGQIGTISIYKEGIAEPVYTYVFKKGGTEKETLKVGVGGDASMYDDDYTFVEKTLEAGNYSIKASVQTIRVGGVFAYEKNPSEPVDPTVEYTVTFNAGAGAIWTDGKLASQLVKKNGKAVRPDNPVKNGHRLESWLKPDGTVYNFETETVTGDITLTAKWVADPEQVTKYEVTFVTGEGASKVPAQEVMAGGKAVEPADPVLDGKLFDGWYADGATSPFDFEHTVITSDITLTAKWKEPAPEVNKYTVTFDLDGGEFENPEMQAQLIAEGGKAVKPADPAREHYTFVKWVDADGAEYNFETPVTADITLTAQWTLTNPDEVVYRVTFVNGEEEIESEDVIENGKISAAVIAKLNALNKTGHTLLGWFNGEEQLTEDTVITADVTFTAKWQINEYTVTFDVAGGTPEAEPVKAKYGSTLTLPAVPAKEGYIFDGWYNGSVKLTEDTLVTEDVTYTAKWISDSLVFWNVTFESEGEIEVEPLRVEDGTTIENIPAVTRDGYAFDGWYDGEDKLTEDTVITADTTYTAVWTKLHKVTFSKGEYEITVPAVQTVRDGAYMNAPAAPSLDGYEFLGWFAENADLAYDFENEAVTADLTLTAKFRELHYDDLVLDMSKVAVGTLSDGAVIADGVKAVGALTVENNSKSFVFNGQTVNATNRLKLNSSGSKFLQVELAAKAKILVYAYSGTDGVEVTMRLMNTDKKTVIDSKPLGCGGVIIGKNETGTSNNTVSKMGVVLFEADKGTYLINGDKSANVFYLAIIYNEFEETFEKTEATAAGCVTAGNIECYYSNYGRYSSTADGANIITASSTVTLPVGHDYVTDGESLTLPTASDEGSVNLVCRTNAAHDALTVTLPVLGDERYSVDSETQEGKIAYSFEYKYDYIVDSKNNVIATKNLIVGFTIDSSSIEYVSLEINDMGGNLLTTVGQILKGGTVTAEQLTKTLKDNGKIPEGKRVKCYYMDDGATAFPFEDALNEEVTVAIVEFEDLPNEVTIGFNSTNIDANLTAENFRTKSFNGIINLNIGHGSAAIKSVGGGLGNGVSLGGKTTATTAGTPNYIEIDLTGVSGEATVKFEMASGSTGRSMFIATKTTNSITDASVVGGSVATATVVKTLSTATVTLTGGVKYYLCTDNTVYLYGIEVTYTP